MWKNDSTYQGNNQNSGFFFKSPIYPLSSEEDEYNKSWVYLSTEKKQSLSNSLKKKNELYNLSLPRPNDLTSYDNPDYLWLSFELDHIRCLYNEAICNPRTHEVLPGYKKIPYIQLQLKSTAYSASSRYPKATLNNYGFEFKPHYVIDFEKPFLQAFMNFIFNVFDDNPQQYIEVNGIKIITHQHRAPIYRLEPFAKYFDTRHDIPGTIFSKAIQMLLAHEIAHVGYGHLDLKVKDPEFGNDINTIIVEEKQADNQAICWLLGYRFLETNINKLNLSLKDLFEELSLSIFSVYLLYTWDYSRENRIWSNKTIKNYGHRGHLPYQLRAFNLLNISCSRLKRLAQLSIENNILTADNKEISEEFMNSVFDEAISMIESFEHSYHMFFARTEDVCRLALDNDISKLHQAMTNEITEILQPLSKESIPWRLGLEPEAQEELKRVNDLEESVIKRIITNECNYIKLTMP